uniref:HlyD family efflux transporter periplasmic adaptor subunit n=1 Tax=Acidobacterium capsulatum TaxID=33075 RepID=A0A7V4XQ86_9BACT
MLSNLSDKTRRRVGRMISVVSIAGALITGALVARQIIENPRTDDAEVFANFIGMAPIVNGPIMQLNVVDNEYVKQGQLLLDIDERPYAYALKLAKSDQAALEGKILDESRTIASQGSAVSVTQAGVKSAEASLTRANANVQEARAEVADAKAAVARTKAELAYATHNLHRIEPLLAKQYVTVDQVDQARTMEATRQQAYNEAQAQQALAAARLTSAIAQQQQAQALLQQSQAQVKQAAHAVLSLDPLLAQRSGAVSAIETAEYNLENCKIYAPFDGRVTNLTISQGEYAHAGQQIFTLIDTRVWWVVANFRETQLAHIRPGMPADVYILSRPDLRLHGVVDSVGYGVTPDADIVGKLTQGLPDVQRTLNWVHLASRFPVRIRILNGPRQDFRLGESAVVVVHGSQPLLRNFKK